MNLDTLIYIYDIATNTISKITERNKCVNLRKKAFKSIIKEKGFEKIAFDTRRINQETDYNPRRGLQNYNRSEPFISEDLSYKLSNLVKLRNVLSSLKDEMGREPEWQDSNARVLLSTLDKGLRVDQQDGDFAVCQPAQGSLDYIEELLHVRYRLNHDELSKLGATDLKKIILSKDENLTFKDIKRALKVVNTNNDAINVKESNDNLLKKYNVSHETDTLMDKLFGGVKASKENPGVERTVTITIKDKLVE